jgi:hypothetical protein
MKSIYLLAFSSFFFITSCGSDEITGSSDKSYREMDKEVGCSSKHGDDKKENTFNENYQNKWMTFEGEVVIIDGARLSLNCDFIGLGDVDIEFEDEKEIYDLTIGSYVKVKFAMRELGGCFLPYSGDQGQIIKKDMDIRDLIK